MPTRPTGWLPAIASIQRRDREIARHGIEAFAQGFGHRHAMRTAVQKLGVALFARQPDALDARQSPGIADIADQAIDAALEFGRWHESLDRDRRDGLAGIGRLAGFLDEIDYLAPDC